jgi:signal transduction histidine kinase
MLLKLHFKLFILLSMILCLQLTAFAQKKMADSIWLHMPAINNKNDDISVFLNLSEAYLLCNTDSALYYAKTAYAIAGELKNNSFLASSNLALGKAYNYINNQIDGVEYLLQAKDLFQLQNNSVGIAKCNLALGELYTVLGQNTTGRLYFNQALAGFTAENELVLAGMAKAFLGDNYIWSDMSDSAWFFSKQAEAAGLQTNDLFLLEFAYSNMVDLLLEDDKFNEAANKFALSNGINLHLGNIYGIAYGKIQEARIVGGNGNFKEAMRLLDSAITLGRMLHMDDILKDAEEFRYLICKKLGKNVEALEALEKHIAIADTLVGQSKFLAIDSLLTSFRSQKKEGELLLLKQKNTHAHILTIGLCVIIFLIAALLIAVYARSKERKWTHQQLEEQHHKIAQKTIELEKLNQVKDKMFSIISHDLRGPIASFKSLVEFMKSDSLSASESSLIVQELKQSMAGVDMLLENLLVWAQLQIRGEINSFIEPISVEEITNEVVVVLANQAAAKQIQLRQVLEPNLCVIGDRNSWLLILRNLISNAIKYTPAGGTVFIEALTAGNKIEVSVKDTGIGMHPHEIEKLFNIEKPFSKRGTQNEKGSGLGLMFVREYVKSCGGELAITSEPNLGSRFCITI